MISSFPRIKWRQVPKKPIELTVDRSTKVDAPSFLNPSDDFITLARIEKKLAVSRAALTKTAESADDEFPGKRSYSHPVFGERSLNQWTSLLTIMKNVI